MATEPIQATASVTQSPRLGKSLLSGLQACLPLSISVFTYGLAYGALAHSTDGLDLLQTLSMSVLVFAGASQFTILALLHQGSEFWAIVSGAVLLNGRQILYGLTLGPHMRFWKRRTLAALAHGLTDESFAVAAAKADAARISPGFFAGAGFGVFGPWLLASLLGFLLGAVIRNPAVYGLDFAYIGAFLGLFIASLKTKHQLVSGLFAAIAATLVGKELGTTGAVLTGALVSFIMGVTKR